jgi:WD40 repeat protein
VYTKRYIAGSASELEAIRANAGSCMSSVLSSTSPSNENFTSQAKVTIRKALKQAFNMGGVNQARGISESVREQMDKNREAVLKVIELLCNAKILDDESAEFTLEQCLENVGNTLFAPAQIQTEQGSTDYDKRLAATHALIVKLFKHYISWCKNTNDPAFMALPRYYVQQRYCTDLVGRHTKNLTDYFQQWLEEENESSLVVFGDAGGGKSLLTYDWEEKLWARVPAVWWIDVGRDQVKASDYPATHHALVVWHYKNQWLLTYRSKECVFELNVAELKGYEFAQILAQESYDSLCADKIRRTEVSIGIQGYWLQKQRQRIPYRIPLGDYTSKNVGHCVELHLKKWLEIDEDAIALLKANVPFLFLLDGYDEIKIEQGLFRENLYRSNGLSSWSAKVLFTCRSQYFNSRGWRKSCFNVAITADERKVYLAQFKSSDIEAYIDRYAAFPNKIEHKDEILASISENKMLTELLATPLLLNLYVRGYVEGAQPPETRWELYQHLMSQLFERQAGKQLERQSTIQAAPEILAQDYGDVSAELAFALVEQNKEVLSGVPQRPRRCPQVLENEEESPLVSFFAGEDPVHDELRRGHPFKRTSDGSYGFIHESFKEYFIAKYMLSNLDEAANFPQQASQTWNIILLPEKPVVLRFLKEAIGMKALKKQKYLRTFLSDWVGLKDLKKAKISANAASLLVQLGHCFSNQDLSGTYLMGANLSGGMFDSTNFTDADCSGANFSKAWLRSANFTGATLDNTKWGEYPKLKLARGVVKALNLDAKGGPQVSTVSGYRIYIWDGCAGKFLNMLKNHTGRVSCLTYRPGRTQLASGSNDGTVCLWESTTGELLAELAGHNDWVRCLSYNPDGTYLASGGDDHTVRLWNVDNMQEEAILRGHTDWVRCLSYRPGGTQLASGSEDRTIRLWNIGTRRSGATLAGHTGIVSCLSYSPGGAQLVSGSYDCTLRLWNVDSGQLEASLVGHTSWILCVSYSPDGAQLASGSEDGTVRLWSVGSRRHQETRVGHIGRILCLSYSHDGAQLATGGCDRTVRFWNIDRGYHQAAPVGHTDDINFLSYSSDGTQLVSGSSDNTLRLWNVGSGSHEVTFTGHTSWVLCLSYSPDGAQLASGGSDNTLRFWSVKSGRQLSVLPAHTQSVNCLDYHPDGKQLASGSSDRTVCLWDVHSGYRERILAGHTSWIHCLSYSPNGELLASGSDDCTVCLWDVGNGRLRGPKLRGHTEAVLCLSFSPNGSQLASGSSDSTLRLWNLANNAKFNVQFSGAHDGAVTCLCYHRGGTQLASGSDDKTLRVWDLTKYTCLRVLSMPQPILSIDWHRKSLALSFGKVIVHLRAPHRGDWQVEWRAVLNPVLNCHNLQFSGDILHSTVARLLAQYGGKDTNGTAESSSSTAARNNKPNGFFNSSASLLRNSTRATRVTPVGYTPLGYPQSLGTRKTGTNQQHRDQSGSSKKTGTSQKPRSQSSDAKKTGTSQKPRRQSRCRTRSAEAGTNQEHRSQRSSIRILRANQKQRSGSRKAGTLQKLFS